MTNLNQRPTPCGAGRCYLLGGFCLLACAGLLAVGAVRAPGTALPSDVSCTTQPKAGPAPLGPGVSIDWRQPAVLVDSEVVMRRGPLEFFACRPGKEHESILRLNASATHIYMALGLIGVSPGHPPIWNDTTGDYDRPAGDLIDIRCEWEQDGRQQSADAFDWLREIEYARRPVSRPWVFAGSLRLADGSLAAEHSGAVFAVVDFPESLVSLTGRHSSSNAELWLEAACDEIPAIGTPVRLVLRPAQPRRLQIKLDFRGAVFVDGRYVAVSDLANLLLLARQLEPQRIQSVHVSDALKSDQDELLRGLRAAGCPAGAIRFDSSAQPLPARTEPAGP